MAVLAFPTRASAHTCQGQVLTMHLLQRLGESPELQGRSQAGPGSPGDSRGDRAHKAHQSPAQPHLHAHMHTQRSRRWPPGTNRHADAYTKRSGIEQSPRCGANGTRC